MLTQDRLLVCRAGHLITERLTTRPDLRRPRCDRCAADTPDRCDTCGTLLAGARPTLGLDPIGWRPPAVCATCGAAFPWARPPDPPADDPRARLDHLLRRLPRVARELGRRARAPLVVRDDRDLDDLVRALLPVGFDDVRPEARTPPYSPTSRTAFVLADAGVTVVAHLAWPGVTEADLAARLAEDVREYAGRALVVFVHDPERRLADPRRLEAVWSRPDGAGVRCLIAR